MMNEQYSTPSTNKNQLVDAVINAASEWYEKDYASREVCTASEARPGSAVRELLGAGTEEDSCVKAGRHVCGPLGG